MLRKKSTRLKERKPPLYKLKKKNSTSYINKGVLSPIYLSDFKRFCNKCLKSLEVEKGFKEIKINSLKKIVYSAHADVIYIYLRDKYTAQILMETLNHWFCHTDPFFKGSRIDELENHNTYIIELNYMNSYTIKLNKEQNLENIIV